MPDRLASHEITVGSSLTPKKYAEFLKRGYRRFGSQIYRPVCSGCRECISLRVLAGEYEFSASDRRVLRQNAAVRRVLVPAAATPEHVRLFNRYQAFMHHERGWSLQQNNIVSYAHAFLDHVPNVEFEWRYYLDDSLVGVALMDRVPDAVSLVYFFYDPDWRPKSPGRFSILNQILFAKEHSLPYVYLGYMVADCRSLNYKDRYWPYETLDRYVGLKETPVWRKALKAESVKLFMETS